MREFSVPTSTDAATFSRARSSSSKIKLVLILSLGALLFSSSVHGAVIVNSDFDTGSLGPWYNDRIFGSNRSWRLGSLDPHSGGFYAFSLGEIEMRQNFTATIGSEITTFSFFVGQQFANLGNPKFEIFYSDGTSTGFQQFVIDPTHASGSSSSGWFWDEVNLLPFVDSSRSVSGVSIVGIPNNVLRVDTFTLTTVPEPTLTMWFLASSVMGAFQRRRIGIQR